MSLRFSSAHRREFIGGSDARIIMGDDEAALLRLWKEKRGEIEPEDLSSNLIVQLGLVTENLNRLWYERNTGQAIECVQRRLRHPVLRWMGATLDGMVAGSGSADIWISTHLPPPVMIESTAPVALVTHILCWSWAVCFSAAASSENDQGSMNLASNTAPVLSTMPSSVAAIQRIIGCRTQLWTSLTTCPVARSYQRRLIGSVATPSWTMRFAE